MNLRPSILLMSSLILSSFSQDLNEQLDNAKNDEALETIKKILQTNKKTHSFIIYDEAIPPTVIESDEPINTILQSLMSEIVQAEIIDAEADETEEFERNRRRARRVVIRMCNRRRRRRCRYVIVIRRARRN